MGSNTPNLNLYKANPKEDGESTFNIDTMLNDNWDKIDGFKQEHSKLEDEVLHPKMAKTEKQVGSIINLPNAVDGQASVGIEGRTVTNLVKNGNFANGTTGWEASNGVLITVENGKLKFSSSSTSAFSYISTKANLLSGRKYYITHEQESNKYTWYYRGLPSNIIYHEDTDTIDGKKSAIIEPNIDDTFIAFRVNNSYEVSDIYVDNFMIVDLTATFGAGNEPTLEECDKIFSYISGTKSTTSTRIKSVGKNLFDKNSFYNNMVNKNNDINIINDNGQQVFDFQQSLYNGHKILSDAFKLNTQYTITIIGKVDVTCLYVVAKYTDGSTDTLNINSTSYATFHLTTDRNKTIDYFYLTYSSGTGRVRLVDNIQLEEGSTPTPYEPYKESISYITLPEGIDGLHSLPNGVKDEVTTDRKLIKRTKEYVFQESDVIGIYATHINLDWARIAKKQDAEDYNSTSKTRTTIIDGYQEYTGGDFDNVSNVGKFSSKTHAREIWIGFSKGTTVEQAQQALAGIKVIYQLAEPQIYDLAISPVACFKDGTIYIESADGNSEYVVPETQITYPINTAGAIHSNTMAINQLSNQYKLSNGQQLNVSDEQKLQFLGQQITQLKLGGM